MEKDELGRRCRRGSATHNLQRMARRMDWVQQRQFRGPPGLRVGAEEEGEALGHDDDLMLRRL